MTVMDAEATMDGSFALFVYDQPKDSRRMSAHTSNVYCRKKSGFLCSRNLLRVVKCGARLHNGRQDAPLSGSALLYGCDNIE
mmetsp:Transcript_27375/g.63557  ORF Transcript_27375/g.63557 Transcript_27375/m.63557 type:complete len:82 (-) Transcript_27375:983-1228(-)